MGTTKPYPYVMLIFLLLSIIIGCGGPPRPAPEIPEGGTLRIGLYAEGDATGQPNIRAAYRGATDAAEKLSKETNRRILVEVKAIKATGAPDERQYGLEGVTSMDAAVLYPDHADAGIVKAVDNAVAKGIPVLCLGMDVPESKRFAFCGPTAAGIGKLAMYQAAKVVEGGVIRVIGSSPDSVYDKEILSGVREEAMTHEGFRILGIMDCGRDPDPDIEGDVRIFPDRCPGFQGKVSDKRAVISRGALPKDLDSLKRGVTVLLGEPAYDWGYSGVRVIVNRLIKGKPTEVINEIPLEPVSLGNLAEWSQKLSEWGYSGIPKSLKERPGVPPPSPSGTGGTPDANEAPETGTGIRRGNGG